MKVTAFFILILGLIFVIGAVSGYFPPPSLLTMWIGGLIGLFLMVSSYFVVKKRLRWAYIDLIILLTLDGYFVYLWRTTGESMPYALMSLPSLFVTAVLFGSLLRELKKAE